MEKKKMLLMTGLSVSALAVSLIVTLNGFGDKPTLADSDAQYSVTFEKSNTTYKTSNDTIVYARPNQERDFEISCTSAPFNPDEDLCLIEDEMGQAATLTLIWNIKSVVVNYVGEGHVNIDGDFFYYTSTEKNRYGEKNMQYYSGNNSFDYRESGQKVTFVPCEPKYSSDNTAAVGYSFYPNRVRIQGSSDAENIRIQSITINYDCH